jgi:hypothetical protein
VSRRVFGVRAGPILAVVAALALLSGLDHRQSATASIGPELPREYIETTYVPPSGQTIPVSAGEDFQAALDAARPGDVIIVEAGARFMGPFTLPNKAGSDWIIIRSSALGRNLPPGTRADPSHASLMPKLEAAHGSVVRTAPRAHHYRFFGIEIRPKEGVFLNNLVLLGKNETAVEDLPHHIVFDRCYLHGDPKKGARRGIAMNSRYTAVIDSYLSDFKEVGAEAQAILGWNGPGPYKIVNNYLEGAGENIMFGGGADPTIPKLVPSDIEIRHNHFFKPLSWKIGDPTYTGTPWMVKNLLELKNARRVLVEGNLFEHNWPHAQDGLAILFTVRNQNGAAPWAVVEDVTFTNNVVRHLASGINILGHDDNHPSQQTKRILIQNNLFEDVGGARWGGGGILFQVIRGTADVVIDHNTGIQTGNIILADGAPNTGFVYRHNITPHNNYGIIGTDMGVGNPTLLKYFPDGVVKYNVIAGGDPAQYPPDNFFPSSLDDVRFTNNHSGNYQLASSSRYKKASSDGKDLGVDYDSLCASMPVALQPKMYCTSNSPPGKRK